jgi:C1A family cysteine protease
MRMSLNVGMILILALLVALLATVAKAQELQVAPSPPVKERELPPRTGFIPHRVDQSHITGQELPDKFKGLPPPPAQYDWRTLGKVTSVKNQSVCGACYAFAALANIESKMLIDGAGTYDFSENNAKECNWYDRNCSGGNYWHLASLFSKTGTVLESCDPYNAWNDTCNTICPHIKTLLDWRRICGASVPATTVLQNYIQTYGPAYTVLYVGDSSDPGWDTEFNNYDGSYVLYYTGSYDPNHAVCIVGWDDNIAHAGGNGAWIVKNSWGTGWGGTCGYGSENGYFYMAYGSARIGEWSSYIHSWQNFDTNGNLLYYDEGGWTQNWGYGSTTAWGMCKYVPASACQLTRVEFWTTDITTDVDVYIYDTYSAGTLSGLLASESNSSYSEVGYHSVALSTPPSVAAGNDVYVAVAFTNSSYGWPIAADNQGAAETNKTYISFAGTGWTELGASGADVAIRLRTTTPGGAPGISVAPDTLKFGQVQVGGDSSLTLRVKSTGTDTLKVTDINPSSGVLSVSDTAFSLAPSESTDVTVTFTPAGVQSYSESLTLMHNAKGSTVVPVTGEGISAGAPGISVSPDTLKFGQVPLDSDSIVVLWVKSTGTDTLYVNDINVSTPILFVPDTAFSLAPSESTDVPVTFNPAAIQSYAESLMVFSNAAKGVVVVPVTGQGVAALDLVIAADDIQFDNPAPMVGDTVTIAARVHNVAPKGRLVIADSVLVRFYDGDPDIGGIQIGSDQIIPAIEPDSSEVAQVKWAAGGEGIHYIFVRVDPDDEFMEASEGNNEANKAITVSTNPQVVSVILSDPSPTAAGEVDFVITFNRKMDVGMAPTASYGLTSPYDAHTIAAAPGWSADSTTWTGRDTVEAGKGDGLNTIRIEGAQDPAGYIMETDTSRTFFIDTAAPMSQAHSPACVGTTSFDVTWTGTDPAPGSGIATYTVYVLVDGLFPTAWLSNTTDTSAVYSGTDGHFYSFYSLATDGAGNQEAAPGAPDCTTYVDTSPPTVPALLSPSDDFITGDNTPTLIWGQVSKGSREINRPEDASGRAKTPMSYHLQTARDAGFTDLVVDISGLIDTSYTIGPSLPDSSYFWRVQATDMAQHSSGFQPTPFKFTVDTQPPLISSTTDWPDTSFGGPFMVESSIGDVPYVGDPPYITLALLWYRTDQDTLWRADTMHAWMEPFYTGNIPEQAIPNTVVEYYVYAEDKAIPANCQTDPVGAPGGGIYSFTAYVTGVSEERPFSGVPKEFSLYQNYPDPFNANTEILYALPKSCQVRLEIYNVLGQRVMVLVDEAQMAGFHTVPWDGRDAYGQPVASGVYLYRLQAEEYSRMRKMVLLR